VPAPDMLPALILDGFGPDLGMWASRIGTILAPFQVVEWQPQWNGTIPFPLGGMLCVLLILLGWHQTAAKGEHRLVFFGFLSLTLVFSLTVYPLHFRHLSLVGLLLILLMWLRARDGERPDRWFRLWLLSMTVCGLATAALNLYRPFDTAQLAVDYIREHKLEDKHWLAFPDSRAQGISALTGIEFERTEQGCTQQFIRWNHRSKIRSRKQLENYLRLAVNQRGQFYMLSDLAFRLPPDLARKIAAFPAGYGGQEFYIFLIGPDAPERPVKLPRCVEPIRPLSAARWQ